jgi:hypothetical protein
MRRTTMSEPYRTSAAERPKYPSKIVQITASERVLYCLDEDGLVWCRFYNTAFVGHHANWWLLPEEAEAKENNQ